jgi:hypothetical protein
MPILTRYVGLIRAGAWSIWLEVFTLAPVLFSIYSNQLLVQVFIFGVLKKEKKRKRKEPSIISLHVNKHLCKLTSLFLFFFLSRNST